MRNITKEEKENLQDALNEISKVVLYVNNQQTEIENSKKMFLIQEKLGKQNLIIPSRKFKNEFEVKVNLKSKTLYQFNDIILICKKDIIGWSIKEYNTKDLKIEVLDPKTLELQPKLKVEFQSEKDQVKFSKEFQS